MCGASVVATCLFAGRLEMFVSWLSTHVNPAAAPSRRWDTVRLIKVASELLVPTVVRRLPKNRTRPQYHALLLCGGRAHDDDIKDWIECVAAELV